MSTPHIKFENSPVESLADSFVSSPGTQYPPLFDCMDSMDHEAMTPESHDDHDEEMFGDSMDGSMAGTPAPEKKTVKKRKSWGQQLPEPKTNLPPRKRAKTEDEKEQRRVERVLRNRRAAQSSRERKRQEVEALEAEKRAIERRNQDLELRLADMEAKNARLQQELEQFTGNMTVFRGSSPASSPIQTEQYHQAPTPITLARELFSSQEQEKRQSLSQQPIIDIQPSQTVDPASLSPEMRPVVESSASSSDMTQHPAAMLCDLQCQSEELRPWTSTTSQILTAILFTTITSTLLSPLSQIITSLRTRSSLSPTSSILTTMVWLLTTTASLSNSTSTNISTTTNTTSPRPKFSLRIRLLNQLLASSPNLARPLTDATLEAMRSLQFDQHPTRDCLNAVAACDRQVADNSPSLEALMTLLWAIRVFEKRRELNPELDAAKDGRQEPEGLFKEGVRGVSYVSVPGTQGQKSLEGWRSGV